MSYVEDEIQTVPQYGVPLLAKAEYLQEATKLASEHSLELITQEPATGYYLYYDARLSLKEANSRSQLVLDFCGGELHHRSIYGANRSSLLAKAIGAHTKATAPRVLDATAGLARDAFVLATLGCEVQALERSKVIYLLLQDACRRARQDSAILEVIQHLNISLGNAIQLLRTDQNLTQDIDVIYLDPMFPHEKRSALVKKEMRICRDIVGADEDAEALFEAAFSTAVKKIVVKRMRTAPTITALKPTWQLLGKTNRFDVYLRNP